MNRVSVLDCTLRDGGYVNNFDFGESVIKQIITKLSKASIDIIECGFLKKGEEDRNKSLYGSVEAAKKVITKKNHKLMYVGMIQYGGISNEQISNRMMESIDGIRLTFHEHEIEPAFILGKQLMEKGYEVFMQPVGTAVYTDEALLKLVDKINELRPFAFYLVDTLGTMYKNDLLRMFYLVDHNLDKSISLGFHSHNNLQLSFANAQELMQLNTPRKLIIDSSVFGMGRGAGNLNTELVTQYINTNLELRYDNVEIIEIIDEYIRPLSTQYKWGYDAAYYIASITGCHPNYASYLLNKQTLHVQDIYAILSNIDMNKRTLFDNQYIGNEYLKYMNHHIDDSSVLQQIKELINSSPVLLLAPGKSLGNNVKEIDGLIQTENYFVMSVNFIPKDIHVDMVFISNMKRYRETVEMQNNKNDDMRIIITSNIATKSSENIFVINYSSYTNEEQSIVDNAGLMCINMLKKIGISKVNLVGFDGYTSRLEDNFYESSLWLDVETEHLMKMNEATTKKLKLLSTQMEIIYFSDSVYQRS